MMLLPFVLANALAFSPVQARRIDAGVTSLMNAAHTPGVSIAIVNDGRIVYARGYGFRNLAAKKPVDANTVFRWGSVSKQFVAGAALMLAGEAKLSLDDPVARWFPAFTGARTIALRDLLNQVSGYKDYYPLDYVDLEMSRPTTTSAVLDEYAKAPLTAPPRTRWEYSNTNYTIAGAIVQRASGERLSRYYAKHIFAPLGMTRSWYDEPYRPAKDRATGYNSYWTEPQHRDALEWNGWLNAAGALAGTASDLARWDIGLMTHRILRAAQFAEMTKDRHIADGKIDTHYGLGVGVYRVHGHLMIEHGGNVIGFASENIMLPDDRTAIVVLTNSYEAPAGAIARKIAALLVPALSSEPKKAQASTRPVNPNAAQAAVVARVRAGLQELAKGTMPRSAMTPDFAHLMNARNRSRARAALARLGTIERIAWLSTRPRGGLDVTAARVTFANGSATALLYETPAHRIAELMLFP